MSAPAVTSHSPVLDQARLFTGPVWPTNLWPWVAKLPVSSRPPEARRLQLMTWTLLYAPDTAHCRPRPGLRLTRDLAHSSHSLRLVSRWDGGEDMSGRTLRVRSRILLLFCDRGADSEYEDKYYGGTMPLIISPRLHRILFSPGVRIFGLSRLRSGMSLKPQLRSGSLLLFSI